MRNVLGPSPITKMGEWHLFANYLSLLAACGITGHFAKTQVGLQSILAHESIWKWVRLSGSAAELLLYIPLPDSKMWEACECLGPF